MPSKSKAQKKLFTIAAHDAEFAKKNHITTKTAKHWHAEDKKAEKAGKQDALPETVHKGKDKKS